MHSLSSGASHLSPPPAPFPSQLLVRCGWGGLMNPIPWQLMTVGKGRVSFLQEVCAAP